MNLIFKLRVSLLHSCVKLTQAQKQEATIITSLGEKQFSIRAVTSSFFCLILGRSFFNLKKRQAYFPNCLLYF